MMTLPKSTFTFDVQIYLDFRTLNCYACRDLSRLKSRDQDLQQAQKTLKDTEAKLGATVTDLKKAKDEKDKLAKEKKELGEENDALKKNQDELRKQLEAETMAKIQAESKARDNAQQLTMKSQTYEQQIAMLTVKNQTEVKAVGDQLQKEYNTKLEEAIKALRDDCNAQIAANKDDQDKLYGMKEENMRKQMDKAKAALQEKINELEALNKKLNDLEKKIQILENENRNLQKNLKDAEKALKDEQARSGKDKKALEAELKAVQDEKDKLIDEYQDLMEEKVQLDNEIAVYTGLLVGEEKRLQIPNAAAAAATPTPTAAATPEKQKGHKQAVPAN